MDVRQATPADELAVRRLLDGAMLETDGLETRIAAADVLVAVEPRGADGRVTRDEDGTSTGSDADRILGAIVLEPRDRGAHVAAIAVSRRRRDRGIGTALIEAALDREGRLTATFDEAVAPFYEAIGFAIERQDGARYRGSKTSEA